MAGLHTVLLLVGLAVASIEATSNSLIIPFPKFAPLAVASAGAKILGVKTGAKLVGVAALPLLAKKAVATKVVAVPAAAALAAFALFKKHPTDISPRQVVILKDHHKAVWPAAWPETSAWPEASAWPATSDWPATSAWPSAWPSGSAWPSTTGAGGGTYDGFSYGQSFGSGSPTGFTKRSAPTGFSGRQAPFGFGVGSVASGPALQASSLPAFSGFAKQPSPAVAAYPAFTADTGVVSGGHSVGQQGFGASQAVAAFGQSSIFPAYSVPKSSGATYASSYPVFSQARPGFGASQAVAAVGQASPFPAYSVPKSSGAAYTAGNPVYSQARPGFGASKLAAGVVQSSSFPAYSVPKSSGAAYATSYPVQSQANPFGSAHSVSRPVYHQQTPIGSAHSLSQPIHFQVKPVGSAYSSSYPVFSQAKPVGAAFGASYPVHSAPSKSAGAEYATAGRFPASLGAQPVSGGVSQYSVLSAASVPVYQTHPLYAVGPTIKL